MPSLKTFNSIIMKNYYIAWWNLENLFDVQDSEFRPAYLQSRLRSELQGWDEAVLDKKLNQLASIIMKMNNSAGPDVLGVCEVENKRVLEMLLAKLQIHNRNYGIAHHDMSDNRGIDIAFIYDKSLFTLEGQFHYEVLKRSATRDIFQVNLRTMQNNPLIVIGNHWPARIGGAWESEPYRIIAAETLSYWLERIFDILGNNIPVVVMGDFNDQCFDRSLSEYANSTNSATRVRNARIPRLFNLMWPLTGEALGTFYFDNFPLMIDQMLVTRGLLLNNTSIRLAAFEDGSQARIEKFSEMISGGQYPDPIRFGRPSARIFNPETGFSDHYPVAIRVREKVER
jgi:hypothetical protein